MTKRKRKPSRPIPYTGDHGPGTTAATAGTMIEAVEGQEHNRTGRRRRINAIESITLTMRQEQAAKAIEEAWCLLQRCSSGGELKEQVDASPKPDATVARQVDAQSRWHYVTAALMRGEKRLVQWVCCENQSILLAKRKLGEARATERFREAMDRVANHLRY